MMRSILQGALVLAVVSAFFGCASEVSSPEGDGGGGADTGDNDGGSGGGSDTCEAYGGDGCKPGDTRSCGADAPPYYNLTMSCEPVDGVPCMTRWETTSCNTPLVLSFDAAPVAYRV